VNLAILLTYLGVAVAGLQVAVSGVISWQLRESLSGLSGTGRLPASTLQTSVVLGIVLSVVLAWLLPGAGAVITAILSGRGANPARVVLASLMGLFALVSLCGVTGGAASIGLGTQLGTGLSPGGLDGGWVWTDLVLDLIKFALAVTIGVLLLVPPANRYFSPGPGRRFGEGVTQVPSIHDRP
jgi:hypothetical protein